MPETHDEPKKKGPGKKQKPGDPAPKKYEGNDSDPPPGSGGGPTGGDPSGDGDSGGD